MNRKSTESGTRELVEAFYERLISAYGYTSEQMGRDVRFGVEAQADIAIWRSAESRTQQSRPDICVVVICREEHVRIDADRYLSAFKEASLGTTNFFVLHNLKETKVFLLDSDHPMGGVERMGDFPKASESKTPDALRQFVKRMRGLTKMSLIQAFDRCHNIVRNNDKLSPEAAFDEISKIMFVKMLYERKPDGELIFSSGKFLKDEKTFLLSESGGDYIVRLFDEVKRHFAGSELYEESDHIRICRKSFLSILKELECVDFHDMTEDVKGVAYESLVGKTFRGELGQFFTPRKVVDYIIEVLDIREGEMVCDPCCGSGGFLIRAFEHVQDAIDHDIQKRIDATRASHASSTDKRRRIAELLKECDKDIPGSRYGKLCKDYFFGVDANVRMARTAKMNMIMHGDGHVGVYLHDGLLNVGHVEDGRFDVVLINPPYGVHVDRTARDDDGKLLFGGFKTANSAAELLFLERVINLLKPGGRAGLVLPEGIFTNSNLRAFRKLIESRARMLCVTAMPPNVFLASGANVKPNLLFIRKDSNGEAKAANRSRDVCVVNADEDNLAQLAPLVRGWMHGGVLPDDNRIRVIRRDEMTDWAVAPIFSAPGIHFNSRYPVASLSELLSPSDNRIVLQDNVFYSRVTVRLGGKGMVLRDRLRGSQIGTKRQTLIRQGQFVISKIDGKSGAMAVVPPELDNAVVTPDFPVFNIRSDMVLPDYLELVLCHPAILQRITATTSGSTGRRRLSVPRFLSLRIALPSLTEQKKLTASIRRLREEVASVQRQMEKSVTSFYESIIC